MSVRGRVVRLMVGVALAVGGAAAAAADGPTASTPADVRAAMGDITADIDRDTDALNELRAAIAEQRRPLATRLEELRKTVAAKRKRLEEMDARCRQSEERRDALGADADALAEECRFVRALFAEYARDVETRLGTADAVRIDEHLRPIQKALSRTDRIAGLSNSVQRLLALAKSVGVERVGGTVYSGVALDEEGTEHRGRFAVLGPLAYFAADDDGPAGVAVTRFGSAQSSIYDRFEPDVITSIRRLVDGAASPVPVDVTGGDALKIRAARPSLMQHLRAGGLVMIPLLVVAVVALLLAMWKTVELGTIRVRPTLALDTVLHALREGDGGAADAAARKLRRPLRDVVLAAVAHHDAPRDHLEDIMHEQVLASLPRLERNLGTLAVLGGIAPLLGLLGTVTGMIHTFRLVTIFGSGEARLLSGGISEALVTTETGLAIAIPVLLIHAFLVRRARRIIAGLESVTASLMNRLKVPDRNA